MNNLSKLTQKTVLKDLNQEDFDCYLLKTVDSTNNFAKQAELTKPFLLVLSEQQTAGKGRQGKSWYSPDAGNIYMSLKFKLNRDINNPLSLIIGLLISKSIEKLSKNTIQPKLKWPNDLVLNNKKICGILIESEVIENEIEYIIGIGINYALPKKESWWGELGELESILPRDKLINMILKKISQYINHDESDWVSDWEERCIHMNQEIQILTNTNQEQSGVFVGIDDQGCMKIELATGLKLINSGECSIKGLY
tara:strand:- start:11438 stop:12196 length:759 start_codon:yes stop_codon:yes gene_type:complete